MTTKNFDKNSLLKEAIENIREDRKQTAEVLEEVRDEIRTQKTSHGLAGQTVAKYVETMQRSNEQLVKIVAMLDKKTTVNPDEVDSKSVYDAIKKEA